MKDLMDPDIQANRVDNDKVNRVLDALMSGQDVNPFEVCNVYELVAVIQRFSERLRTALRAGEQLSETLEGFMDSIGAVRTPSAHDRRRSAVVRSTELDSRGAAVSVPFPPDRSQARRPYHYHDSGAVVAEAHSLMMQKLLSRWPNVKTMKRELGELEVQISYFLALIGMAPSTQPSFDEIKAFCALRSPSGDPFWNSIYASYGREEKGALAGFRRVAARSNGDSSLERAWDFYCKFIGTEADSSVSAGKTQLQSAAPAEEPAAALETAAELAPQPLETNNPAFEAGFNRLAVLGSNHAEVKKALRDRGVKNPGYAFAFALMEEAPADYNLESLSAFSNTPEFLDFLTHLSQKWGVSKSVLSANKAWMGGKFINREEYSVGTSASMHAAYQWRFPTS